MKPFPWKCMYCRQRTVSPATITYAKELEHDGRKYQVAIPDLEVLRCAHCREMVLDDAANERISDALRAAAGLLLPGEIRQKREGLCLTQKQLAGALQIAEATLSRWETGAQIQQRSMDRLLRAFFDLEALRTYYGVTAPATNEAAAQTVSS